MLNLSGKREGEIPSLLKDPFKQSCIKSISTHCWKNGYSGKIYFTGTIKFVNGNTQGVQEFETEDWPSLIEKMEIFIKQL